MTVYMLPPSDDMVSLPTDSPTASPSFPLQPSANLSPDGVLSLKTGSDDFNKVNNAAIAELPRHSEYFIQDELATFIVEGTVFQMHGFFLKRESEYFRWLLSLPLDSGASHGEISARTHKLPDVTHEEFESLLNYFYHNKIQDVSIEEHIKLLSIATHFKMQKIREYAINELDKNVASIDPVRRILLSRKHDVEQWLRPAYAELCSRDLPLSEEEGEKLGVQTVIRIAKARETVLREEFTASAEDEVPPPSKSGWDLTESTLSSFEMSTGSSNRNKARVGIKKNTQPSKLAFAPLQNISTVDPIPDSRSLNELKERNERDALIAKVVNEMFFKIEPPLNPRG